MWPLHQLKFLLTFWAKIVIVINNTRFALNSTKVCINLILKANKPNNVNNVFKQNYVRNYWQAMLSFSEASTFILLRSFCFLSSYKNSIYSLACIIFASTYEGCPFFVYFALPLYLIFDKRPKWLLTEGCDSHSSSNFRFKMLKAAD